MAFQDILGNERIKKILRLALQKNRLPNSLLFCGPDGVGKKAMARVLAKALNCERAKDDSCEACSSCRAINGKNHPDVLEIFPSGDVVKIEQMRTLKQLAYLRPMCGRKRVFIVAEAEKMNAEAANSLLKVLEEPPLFSQILLVTSNPYLILPTIKSRCQVLNFSPVSRAEIEKVLRDRDYPEDRAKILSLLVRGNLDQALSLDWEEVQQERNDAWLLFLAFLKKDRTSSFLRRFAYQRRNLIREDFEQTLEFLAAFWRDFVLVKEDGDTRFVMNPDYAGEMESLLDLVSLEKSLEYADNIEDAISALNRNLNFSLVVSSLYSNFMG